MAETYNMILSIKILKVSNNEALADEETYLNGQSIQKMTNTADQYFDLVAKLLKAK